MDLLSRIEKKFHDSRVVIFRDPEGQFASDFDSWELPGVEIVRLAGNPFGLKYRILRDEPETKFLVYLPGPQPAVADNWLLDLELAYGVMSADWSSLVAEELGLTDPKLRQIVAEHEEFFKSNSRVKALGELLWKDETPDRLQAKMVAVAIGSRPHFLKDLMQVLLKEYASGGTKKIAEIERLRLSEFFWQGVQRIYQYSTAEPGIKDFLVWMLRLVRAGFSDRDGDSYRELERDFTSWRRDSTFQESLKDLCSEIDQELEPNTEQTPGQELTQDTIFASADREIIRRSAQLIAAENTYEKNLAEIISARLEETLWQEKFAASYQCLLAALELQKLVETEYKIADFESGLKNYADTWFRVDRKYRDFVTAFDKADEMLDQLGAVKKTVEGIYVHNFLVPLNEQWNQQVAQVETWKSKELPNQKHFYADFVEPLIAGGNKKAVVIISDAMRYEVADELASKIRKENRFTAELQPVLGVLPSYTQLGMASLLPHQPLEFAGKKDQVLADGKATTGTGNRNAILTAAISPALAVQAEDIVKKDREELRQLYRDNQVIYIYHNLIDATGDDAKTESRVFSACQDALEDLVSLVKKMANANATNIFITADHGFLYQVDGLDETMTLSDKAPKGADTVDVHRRYVIQRNPVTDSYFNAFPAERLGLSGEIGALIPNSIMRVRQPGKGNRYVHGGAALQEVVVPVLKVNKGRSDAPPVKVSIRQSGGDITSNQPRIELFQEEPVSEKRSARTVTVALYTQAGELISTEEEVTFDSESEEPGNRVKTARPMLVENVADHNGELVELRITEKVRNTSQKRLLIRVEYKINVYFARDFDF